MSVVNRIRDSPRLARVPDEVQDHIALSDPSPELPI
jgi:hypothetical protein